MSDRQDLELLLRSHFPIVAIETHEEQRAVRMVAAAAGRVGKAIKLWTLTEGLRRMPYPSPAGSVAESTTLERDAAPAEAGTHEPESALRAIKKELATTVFVLIDFHHHLAEPLIARLLKEIAMDHPVRGHSVVLLSPSLELPDDLRRYTARFQVSLPGPDTIRELILEEAKLWVLKNAGQKPRADKRAVELLIHNLLGLPLSDIVPLIRNAINDDGAILEDDLPRVAKAKYELLGQAGVLTFEYDLARFSEVGGMKTLKAWLERRRSRFVGAPRDDIDRPKGVLLLGVQGGGKSLAAKAVAGLWGLPLLRLDFGTLYNKFHGQTEKNLRDALQTAAVMAPCVLWADEIEKGVATGDNDGGTSRRVLATLLTWMAENKSRVFIVATANNIHNLPPELVRKGRFDEIFFVDLPSAPAREEIFAIHLRKRRFDPAKFDLKSLAARSDGFSGAEIEQAIVAARYAADDAVATSHILAELGQTKPLSVVMAEPIAALRHWAKARTINAD